MAIFVPKGFRETGTIDFVVHFHGWTNHVERLLDEFDLIEQLTASGRNAVLVVPQGPRDASDSFGGKLEDPDGFKRFMADVATTLRQKSALTKKDFVVGRILLSGHSGGYHVISAILDHGGLTEHVAKCGCSTVFITRFPASWPGSSGSRADLLTSTPSTAALRPKPKNSWPRSKNRSIAFFAGKESETKTADLQSQPIFFLYTDLEHNDVVNKPPRVPRLPQDELSEQTRLNAAGSRLSSIRQRFQQV